MEKTSSQKDFPKIYSISRRFSFTLIGVVTLALFSFAAVGIFIYISKIDSRLENQLNSALKLAETSLKTPLWNFDYSGVGDLVEALFLDEAIVYIRIFEKDEIITTRVRAQFQEKDFSYFKQSSQFIAKASDITYKGEKIGTIQLTISRESVRQLLILSILGIIALTILIIAIISLTSIFITRRHIFHPLLKLQHSAKLIADGNLEVFIDISNDDEIGGLAKALDVMRESIKHLFDIVHESNKKLVTFKSVYMV